MDMKMAVLCNVIGTYCLHNQGDMKFDIRERGCIVSMWTRLKLGQMLLIDDAR